MATHFHDTYGGPRWRYGLQHRAISQYITSTAIPLPILLSHRPSKDPRFPHGEADWPCELPADVAAHHSLVLVSAPVLTIGLVACSKTKLDRPAPARELYTSPLFRAASAYANRAYDRWYILSALHGLVYPDERIPPYDVTLKSLSRGQRERWAVRVRSGLELLGLLAYDADDRPSLTAQVYVHAGVLYRAAFDGLPIVVPLEGLGIGQQLRWYAIQACEASRLCGCGHSPHEAERCGAPCTDLDGKPMACLCVLDEQ